MQNDSDRARDEGYQGEDFPVCPVHGEPMKLFRKVGVPTRFTDQETSSYTLIYRCPVALCDETFTRDRVRNQIPVPGTRTRRPSWAKRES